MYGVHIFFKPMQIVNIVNNYTEEFQHTPVIENITSIMSTNSNMDL